MRTSKRNINKKLTNGLKLVVSDIEGCLMPPTRQTVNVDDLAEISAYCRSAQNDERLLPLVFCTGRQIPYAECVAQMIGAFFPGIPSIVENGAFLYDVANNEIFPNPVLKPDILDGMKEVGLEVDQLIKKYQAKKEYGKEVCISLNPPSGLPIEKFFELVQNELSRCSGLLNISHSKSAVDITPVGIDKASGVRFLAERTGIDLHEILGIGDTRGDLPMLRIVGTPTGPLNACDDVRECSSYIASGEGPRGVAEILRHFTDWN